MDAQDKFASFMQLNRTLLDCYANATPAVYKQLDVASQRDFCYSQRAQVERQLTAKKVTIQDFFKAAQQ